MIDSLPFRRGQIVYVDFDPAQGAEQRKTRPAVVVSNDGANRAVTSLGYGVLTVVPLTSAVNTSGRQRPYQAELDPDETGLAYTSTAQAEQVRAIAIERVRGVGGFVTLAALRRIEDALRVQLGL